MPEKEFRNQWELLGHDEVRVSYYFGITQRRVVERAIFLGLIREQEPI
jgi:hypothetical protein